MRVTGNALLDAPNDPQDDLENVGSEDETSSYHSYASNEENDPKGNDVTVRDRLTDDQLLRCHYLVRGYSLREKAWINFDATKFHNIHFDSGAFDQLVLPKNHRTLILALIKTQGKTATPSTT